MKIEVRETKENNIIQITTLDERWYMRKSDKVCYPSSTWISSYYPKGVAFYKWLAEKGWDESIAIKNSAGNRGSKVHQALESYEIKKEIKMDDGFLNRDGKEEELTVEEWEAIISFDAWHKKFKPKLIKNEHVVWCDEYKYAGTLDRLYEINGEIWLIEFKTSQQIWPEHEIQLSSYFYAADPKPVKMGILQLGYKKNKVGYKFTELENKFELFLNAKKIWENENSEAKPKQKDYPTILTLN